MNTLFLLCDCDARTLRKYITMLLRAGVCDSISKINYAQKFQLNGKELTKKQQKILMLHFEGDDSYAAFSAKWSKLGGKIPGVFVNPVMQKH